MDSKFGGKKLNSSYGGTPISSDPTSGLPEGSALSQAMESRKRRKVDFPTFALATPAGRFIEGAADLPIGAAQFVTESLGFSGVTEFVRRREKRIQEGREAIGSEGLDLPRMAGNIGTSLVATRGMPVSGTVVGRATQAGGLGAVMGASTPATSEDISQEKAEQIGLGTAIGVVASPAVDAIRGGLRAIRNIADPFLPGGTDRTLRRAISETTDNVDELVDSARNARTGQTVGQSASGTGNTRLSALQQAARRVGSAADDYAQIDRAQNASRLNRIRQVGGAADDETLEQTVDAARAARTQQTNPLFEAAKNSKSYVNPQRTKILIARIKDADPRNTKLVRAIDSVSESIGDSTSPRELISAWRNISNLIDETGPNGQRVNETIVRQLSIIKKALEQDIGRAVPEFREANTLFRELSQPINRAQIAQELEKKLTAPLSGSDDSVLAQRAGSFANALSDEQRLIAQSTGFKRGSGLEKYFDEDELAVLGNVAKELSDNAEFNRLSQLGKDGMKKILGSLGPEPVANPLMRVVMIVNSLIRKSGTLRTEATLERAAELFRNPQAFADVMEGATEREVGIVRSALRQIPIDQLTRTAPAVTVNQ